MRHSRDAYKQFDALPRDRRAKKRTERQSLWILNNELILFFALKPGLYLASPVFDLLTNWIIKSLPKFRKYFAWAGAIAGFALFFHPWFDPVFTYLANHLGVHQSFLRVPMALLSAFALASIGDALVEYCQEIISSLTLVAAVMLTVALYTGVVYLSYPLYLIHFGGEPIQLIENVETFVKGLFTLRDP